MSLYDQDRPFVPEARQTQGRSWADAAYYMKLYGRNFTPPANMRGMSLAEIEAKAREETREAREADEARQSAARIEAAPKSIERALLDGPKAQASKPQRGWRQRVRFLNQFKRCGSYREAAARIGVDESTVRRWRAKFEGFRNRCDEILAERLREKSDDLKLRAGEPKSRPYFFKGKQIGEQVIHDDRALMFLLKLEDAQRARAEAREERREQRAHEIRLKEMEIEAQRVARQEARRATRRPVHAPQSAEEEAAFAKRLAAADLRLQRHLAEKAASKMHASAAHSEATVEGEEASEVNDLAADPADIAPREVVEPATPNRRPDSVPVRDASLLSGA